MTFLRFHLISWQLFHGSGFAGLERFDWTPPGVCARYLKSKCRTIDEDIYQLSSVDTSYDEGVFWGIGSDLNLLPSGEMIICHSVKVSMGRTIDPNDSVWKNVVDDRMGRSCAGSFTSLCIRVLLQHKLNVGLTWITLHEQHCLHLITKICPDTNLGPPLWSTLSMCTSCHVTTWIPLPESWTESISTVDRAGSRNTALVPFSFSSVVKVSESAVPLWAGGEIWKDQLNAGLSLDSLSSDRHTSLFPSLGRESCTDLFVWLLFCTHSQCCWFLCQTDWTWAVWRKTRTQQSLQDPAVCLWRAIGPKILLQASVLILDPQAKSKSLFVL